MELKWQMVQRSKNHVTSHAKNCVNLMGKHVCVLLLGASRILFFPITNKIYGFGHFQRKVSLVSFGWYLWQAVGINDMIKGILYTHWQTFFWKSLQRAHQEIVQSPFFPLLTKGQGETRAVFDLNVKLQPLCYY